MPVDVKQSSVVPDKGAAVFVRRVDYANPRDAQALVSVLNGYALDPAGGGEPLRADVQADLPAALQRLPQAYSVLAWATNEDGSEIPVGLVNCFEGFSTFACRPLVNIHDVAVIPAWRGRGIARVMLGVVEHWARQRGACKLTLEVLQGNHGAQRLYAQAGFEGYTLDPAMGQAQCLQKNLD